MTCNCPLVDGPHEYGEGGCHECEICNGSRLVGKGEGDEIIDVQCECTIYE